MARKNVSLLVSAAGWISGFIEQLIALLRERGISDEQIHAFVTDDQSAKKMLEKIADAIAETITSARKVFSVFMDYSMSIEDLVEQGEYVWSDKDITTKNFPTKYSGRRGLKIKPIEFDYNISSEDAIAELEKMNLRPAEAGETLAFSADNPDEQRKSAIVALGNHWPSSDGDRRRVLCLYCNLGKRKADLLWFGYGWAAGVRFAAVRK